MACWNNKEIEVLKKYYPTSSKSKLLSLLPAHSWQSIRMKANSLNMFLRSVTIERKRNGVYVTCETCSKEFYIFPARLRQAKRQGSTIRYCSMACYNKNGKKNPFYGHKHSDDTIRKIKKNNMKNPPSGRPLKKFRIVDNEPIFFTMNITSKNYLKKKIKKCEKCGFDNEPRILVIHHKNQNRKNNFPDNLIVLCPTCHALEHMRYIPTVRREYY